MSLQKILKEEEEEIKKEFVDNEYERDRLLIIIQSYNAKIIKAVREDDRIIINNVLDGLSKQYKLQLMEFGTYNITKEQKEQREAVLGDLKEIYKPKAKELIKTNQ